ncbi:hypothetical protein MSHOH_0326 [Methanosarcina horonobensis HB-1 = JCM 15518]|uniref:Uncharacterized protein n=1 Tax=Methanosarcina horonobensis HB-1 = JCM 15518 TaxID=1434110 RepID=A0A0E3S6G9_9EURY|nr:hypothetical protein [Methanosarcina horonobensis]AKB76809.1 hypothetical protein MSHOH_0326 [Methanosarcina horonobensis HB-1 = JCM 15518]
MKYLHVRYSNSSWANIREKEQENNQKLEKAANVFYNSLLKERRSPGLKDIFIFRAQKASFGEPGQSFPADYVCILERKRLAQSGNKILRGRTG